MNNKIVSELDLKYIWHPCTQHKDHEDIPLIPIKRGEGIYLYDFDGNSYIDCISSWWVNLFGHCNKYINSKLQEQIQDLEHTLLAGFTHEGIVRYSKRILDILGFDKCFYADNGSSAVEVALKMSFHHHRIMGNKRDVFLSLSNSYHGETIGALSVGDVGLYKDTYSDILIKTIQTPVPKNQDIQSALKCLDEILSKYGDRICAFILEPLVQCAGGMHMYSKEYIYLACEKCREYGIHIVFDEIAVGFGRSGSMFAFMQCDTKPDFVCLSKGITGGYMPLSLVATTDEIYVSFYAPYSEQKAFLHSHSYTGNALAIACANATLDIFENDDVIEKNKILSEYIFSKMQILNGFEFVKNLRYCGMIFAFDLEGLPFLRAGVEVYKRGLKHGLLLRPLANTIYFMPPYVITPSEVDFVIEKICLIFMELRE